MKFPQIKFSFACVAFLIYALPVIAEEGKQEESLYIGARLGYSYNQNSCMKTNIYCDETEAGYGIFVGYDFNRHVALELSFNDIGDSVAMYPSGPAKGKLSEKDLALKLTYPIFKHSQIYGKIGAAYWDAEETNSALSWGNSGVSPLFGAGIEVPFKYSWTARLEYQYIHRVADDTMGYANAHFIGFALVWNFGSQVAKKSPAPAPSIPEPLPTPLPTIVVIEKPIPTPEPTQRIVIDEQFGGPLFEFDKAQIRNTAAIDPIVDLLLKNPSYEVSITGHTDSRGTTEYNQLLSEARARLVGKYLNTKGITSNRIKTTGAGEYQPVADNDTEEGRTKNRRVEFVITGTKTLP